MANPQKENGFTPIANEILEALVNTPLLGSEFQVVCFVIRKTYGYQKKGDKISLTQFEKATSLSRPTIVKSLKNLVFRKILLRSENLIYSFNKDYDKWVVNTALLVKHNDTTSKARLTKTSKARLTHKRNKEMTKENTELRSGEIVLVIKSFEKINPAVKKMYGNKNQRQACEDLIEEYGLDRILAVIERTLPKTNGLQYFPTITTPIQLRDKWVNLESAIIKHKNKSQGRGFA